MISFIVAMDKNNVIGYKNEMPWHIPNDMKFFKEKTTNHTIVMGRKTFESIGRVLPNRKHIVLTRGKTVFPDEVEVVQDVASIIERSKSSEEELFVIGGGHIFQQMLPYADRLYVTEIDEEFDGDVYFPEINKEEWVESRREKGLKNEKNPYHYSFVQYDRKTKASYSCETKPNTL